VSFVVKDFKASATKATKVREGSALPAIRKQEQSAKQEKDGQ